MSTTPRATYRFQFHHGFTLRDAVELVPYLHSLGVSHVYASPLLCARPGSEHGYDVTDPSRLNPEIGTEEDMTRLVQALRSHAMGLVLDIVPNHMAVGGRHNAWWWDVLTHGRDSRFATWFDIDFDQPGCEGRLLLPVLGGPLAEVIERGEIRVEIGGDGAPVVRYFDNEFPLSPESLGDAGAPEVVSRCRGNPDALRRLLDAQHYILASWREGDARLNYRRFFSITHLAGVRVELPEVFEAVHQRILDWHSRGWLDGLRVDHPDGLRDPEDYLIRLHASAPGAWITVEKILEPGETLPAAWPVAGTTGYEFIERVGGLFIDPAAEGPLTDFYTAFTGESPDAAAIVRESKRFILREILAAEVSRLVRLFEPVAAREAATSRCTPEELRAAIVEFAACFPVYRTYVRAEARIVRFEDVQRIDEALRAAREERPDLLPVFQLIREVLLLRHRPEESADFVMRFQQLTGPAMAKGLEDTTFYVFNRFAARNEVGGDPCAFATSVEDFHAATGRAGVEWPECMLATSTHDTKRSEDVRARLFVLSEVPSEWVAAVERWAGMNAPLRTGDWPDRNMEYLFYQTVVGAWPLPAGRAVAYMEKAAREAKRHTHWTDPNTEYEEALARFVRGALDNATFVRDVEAFVAGIRDAGYVNALAQTLLKLTAPGVPDIYQGTELWDFSLVDPDNRRPVDYAVRRRLAAEIERLSPEEAWKRREDGVPKMWLIRRTLHLRSRVPGVFSAGTYTPLRAEGAATDHLVAFLRGEDVVVMVPRLASRRPYDWADATITLPGGRWRNELTGEMWSGGRLSVEQILSRFPVALMARTAA